MGITQFKSEWRDGTALSALIEALCPGTLPVNRPSDALSLVSLCVAAAGKCLGRASQWQWVVKRNAASS